MIMAERTKTLAGINNQCKIYELKRQCCPEADVSHFKVSSYRAEDQISTPNAKIFLSSVRIS